MNKDNGDFEQLLNFLRGARGFDFTGYKRQGLMRRIQKRMAAVQVPDFTGYIEYLELHPAEFSQLFNSVLINVTSFFRDTAVWGYLREHVIPKVIESVDPSNPIRIWSAACATGEEPYGLAILLAEAMGLEEAARRVKIYATDVDEDAMQKGRQGTYSQRQVADLDDGLLSTYFERPAPDRYVLNRDLRRCVIFGRNDLLHDAPISRVSLLSCRNALMYFNAEAQVRVLSAFHFALRDEGFLVLGKAETLLTRSHLFEPVDLRLRVFRKVVRSNVRDRLLLRAKLAEPLNVPAVQTPLARSIETASFAVGPIAQIIIGLDGSLALANNAARILFRLSPHDLGRPLQDLELSYRPVELRSLIEQAQGGQQPVFVRGIEWNNAEQKGRFDVQVDTLMDVSGVPIGITATYTDVSPYRQLQEELEKSRSELEAAYEELQSTSEELETTNEELQSTVEELETTNEELQSSNEELETMNEELQSINEEMQTSNEELRLRTDELNSTNDFMSSILASLQTGIVVMDADLRVQAWNPRAEDLWGMRENEVRGKFVLNLDIGLPIDQLGQSLRDCVSGVGNHREMVVPAINRRGRPFQCRISLSALHSPGGERTGVILLMEQALTDGQPVSDQAGGGEVVDG
jgi:two-component system, chemotaxis family, CheB/CheR fusion protein